MTKILIVDDSAERYATLIAQLCPSKLSSDSIQLKGNVRDALNSLREEHFDVLILDMMIPEVPWSTEAIPDGGAKLLEFLCEDDSYKLPKYIIGITAARDKEPSVERIFNSQPWVLLRYTGAGDAWETQLNALVMHAIANEKQQDSIQYKTDICLITALRSPEYEALIACDISWGENTYVDTTTYVRHGSLKTSTGELSVVIGCSLRMGSTESALLSYKLVEMFRPKLLIMGGICAGYEEKVQYGDVIVGSPVWDYTSQKIEKDDNGITTVTFSPDDIPIELEIQSRFEALNEDTKLLDAIYDGWNGDKPRSRPSVKVAPSATGPAVIADSSIFEEIRRTQNRGTLAIEMEAYGVYCAARRSSRPRPIVFCAKAVCDYGSFLKDDKYQKYAAYVSARVIFNFLKKYGMELSKIIAPH